MKLIPLTRGHFAKVDDEDFDRTYAWSWQAQKIGTGWIVKRGVWDPVKKNNKSQPLSLFILSLPVGSRVDHRNGDPFDNQKENLRPCTKIENDRAFRRKSPGKSSQYRGVSWHSQRKRWVAQIHTSGQTYYLGLFSTQEEAARAHDTKAREWGWPEEGMNFLVRQPLSESSSADAPNPEQDR